MVILAVSEEAENMAMSTRTNGRHEDPVEHTVIETQADLDALIDAEARRLLHISGADFMKMKMSGSLPERPGVRALAMMAELGSISES